MAEETISHFRIIRKMGEGATGEVYMAEDTELNRKVALKVMRAEFASDTERLSRFLREARAASSLDHPNVTLIYEVGEVEGTHFIAMQLAQGDTLEVRIQERPMPSEELIHIAVQIAAALDEAHSSGIIHRDLKPTNIMINERGQVKVLDFGLAKLSWEASSEMDIQEMETLIKTQPGIVLGTIDYMSPEQALGKQLDSRTDIFSFGSLLYRAATGRLPFSGEKPMEIFRAMMSIEPEPPSILNNTIPLEFERIILKCLEKDPNRRYQTAKELVVDLKNLQRDSTAERITSRRKSWRFPTHLFRWGMALALVAGMVGMFFYLRTTNRPRIRSLAVLPFVNANSDPAADYLSEGITDNTINDLSRLQGIKVLARATVFAYRGKNVDPRKAGRDLGVDALVTGNILVQNKTVGIQVSLITTHDGAQIWGRRYLSSLSDIQSIQSEIITELQSWLDVQASSITAVRQVHNPEAYELYLRGLFEWNRRTGSSLLKSIEYFRAALDKEPTFAQAYSGLANSFVLLSIYGVQPPRQAIPVAMEAARKALELDDTLAEAHAALAMARLNYEYNWVDSEREFRKAIALNPNYATAHHWYGSNFLAASGRFREAEREMSLALDLDPLSLIINSDEANTLLIARQYDRAIVQFRKVLEMDPNFYYARVYLAQTYALKGLMNEALLELEAASRLDNDPVIPASLGWVHARAGRPERARRALQTLKDLSSTRYVSPYFSALVYAALGETDSAFASLEQAFHERSEWVTYLKVDPMLDSLRSDPRYPELSRRAGVK